MQVGISGCYGRLEQGLSHLCIFETMVSVVLIVWKVRVDKRPIA